MANFEQVMGYIDQRLTTIDNVLIQKQALFHKLPEAESDPIIAANLARREAYQDIQRQLMK